MNGWAGVEPGTLGRRPWASVCLENREHFWRDVNSISKEIEMGCQEQPTALGDEVESMTPSCPS